MLQMILSESDGLQALQHVYAENALVRNSLRQQVDATGNHPHQQQHPPPPPVPLTHSQSDSQIDAHSTVSASSAAALSPSRAPIKKKSSFGSLSLGGLLGTASLSSPEKQQQHSQQPPGFRLPRDGVSASSLSSPSSVLPPFVPPLVPPPSSPSPSSSSLSPSSPVSSSTKVLSSLLSLPGNVLCADCSSPSPTWASTNLGLFICTQCSGVHRSLGVHVSFVLSTRLDAWSDEHLSGVSKAGLDGGNVHQNERWEYHVPDEWPKPHASESRLYREKYIRAKYESRAFVQLERKAPRLNREPFATAQGGGGAAAGGDAHHHHHHGSGSGASSSSSSTPVVSGSTVGMVEFIGYITVHLLKGEHLLSMGYNGTAEKTNPFAVLQLGGQKVTSKVSRDTVNPQWNETHMLCWDGVDEFHVDVFSSDEHMGGATLQIAYLLEEEEKRACRKAEEEESDDADRRGGESEGTLGSIGEEDVEEDSEDGVGGAAPRGGASAARGAAGKGGERDRRGTDSVLLGHDDHGHADHDDSCVWLTLEHRDLTKVGKKTLGVKTKAKRVGRGSVFAPREATGGVFLGIKFERLNH